jgi:hypothetical protein
MIPDTDTYELLENINEDILRDDPLDALVYKLERNSISLDQLFNKLDSDGDGSLTMMEIRTNINSIGVELQPKEVTDLIERLDENTDGVVTKEEFVNLLNPSLQSHRQYKEIVGDIEIYNPIVFEE